MTTPRDLVLTALDVAPRRPLQQGELSLALAGAELVDLLAAGEAALDGDRLVPRHGMVPKDRLLTEAAAALVRQPPYESVEDWLWRRGRSLSATYLAALEADGTVAARRRRRAPFARGRLAPVDTFERRRAADRWRAGEPVLGTLAAAVGIGPDPADQPADQPVGEPAGNAPPIADEAVTTVLATVHDALLELAAVRQQRDIERAAFDNIWRGD